MDSHRSFTCSLHKIPCEQTEKVNHYRLVKRWDEGTEEILWEGAELECRGILERLFRTYARNKARFVVQWQDSSTVVVREFLPGHAGRGAPNTVKEEAEL